MKLNDDFKNKVVAALKEVRKLYGGSDAAFAKQWSINGSVWSRIKNGETEGLIKDDQWINLGRELDVNGGGHELIKAETEVFEAIKNDIEFCKEHSQAIILIDDCGIGKSFTGKYLSKTLPNCFYIDLSQCGNKEAFVRTLGKAIGVDHSDGILKVIGRIKYCLSVLTKPMIIIDEGGDINKSIVLLLKELWNSTDGICGWYMMGADGFRSAIERGIRNCVAGYLEFFNRYGNKFMKVIPVDHHEKIAFYKKLITDVLSVNVSDKSQINQLVKSCLTSDADGKIGGLRKAKTLLILRAA